MKREPSESWPEIPGYRIVRLQGRGGMATVYRAEQVGLQRTVAVKVLAQEDGDGEARARFLREAQTVAALQHPHIVSIIESGVTADGRLYYSMPVLDGGHLGLRGRLPEADARRIALNLLEALHHAHARGFVHRDIKPENILFDNEGRPQLADFGIALWVAPTAERLTRAGRTLGSARYMSPEQARGDKLDPRADLYSVGVVLYQMLTGQLPFTGADDLAIALAHSDAPVPNLPRELAHWQPIVAKALAKRRDERFGSAREMARAIEALALDTRGATQPLPKLNPEATPEPEAASRPSGERPVHALAASILAGESVSSEASRASSESFESASPETFEPASITSRERLPMRRLRRWFGAAAGVLLVATGVAWTIQMWRSGEPATVVVAPSASPLLGGPADVATSSSLVAAPPAPPSAKGAPVETIEHRVDMSIAKLYPEPPLPPLKLRGTRAQQVEQIRQHIADGRRWLDAERARVDHPPESTNAFERQLLRNAFEENRASFERWRQHWEDERARIERG